MPNQRAVPLCHGAFDGGAPLSASRLRSASVFAFLFLSSFFVVECFHSVRTRFIHLKEQSKLFRKINHVSLGVCVCVYKFNVHGYWLRVSCHNQYRKYWNHQNKKEKLTDETPSALHLLPNSNSNFVVVVFFFWLQ